MPNEPIETGVIRLNTLAEFQQQSVELMSDVVRSIDILTPDMDKPWLGHEDVVGQIKRCILKNKRIQVRLLLADPALALRTHHPLIPLIRKISRLQAQVIDQELLEKQPLTESFILVDRGGILVRQSLTDYSGFVHFNDKPSVSNKQEDFDQYWRYSHEHADLRHVYV